MCLTTTFLLSQSNPVPAPISASHADPKAQAKILDIYGKLPLDFEANQGQTDARVKFLSRTGGYTLFLTGDEAVLALSGKKTDPHKAKMQVGTLQSGMAAPKSGGVLRMRLRNANPAAKVTGLDELAGTSNYFIGNDPAKWRTNVPTYAKVKYEGIYSGIDLVYYGNQRQLEYDFIVAPGADPRRIPFDVRGAKRIRQDAQGELVFKVGEDEIRWHKPVVYQEKNGTRQEIAAHYAITDTNRVGFEVAKYDASRPLYIDPLIYSTYLGGSGRDEGFGIAVDSAGNAYVTGCTSLNQLSDNRIPCSRPLNAGGYDAFVAKLNPTGSALVYSTYLGGSVVTRTIDALSSPGIAVDSAGNAYVTGWTSSTNFPSPWCLQAARGGRGNAFVSQVSTLRDQLWFTPPIWARRAQTVVLPLERQRDAGTIAIAVDSAGNAYVTGSTYSTDFPVTPAPSRRPAGRRLRRLRDGVQPYGISFGLLHLSGRHGDRLPARHRRGQLGQRLCHRPDQLNQLSHHAVPSRRPAQAVTCDAFVAKLNPCGSALVYSTYLGGSGAVTVHGIAVDSSGNAYVTGYTVSTNFPTMNPCSGLRWRRQLQFCRTPS